MQFCFKSLQKPLLILQCQKAENDPFLTPKVHGFLVKAPLCHAAPISRMHGGSVLLTGPSVPLTGGSVPLKGPSVPLTGDSVLLIGLFYLFNCRSSVRDL